MLSRPNRPIRSRGVLRPQLGARQSGQALLVAVLLMMAILLVGILFVAIVSYNQRATERDVDVSEALSLARAGVNYVDHELQYSSLGADWRPAFVPYTGPSSTPVPPVALEDAQTGAVTYSPGFYGPDNVPYTDDDYYTEQEILRGYYGIVRVNNHDPDLPDYYLRLGYSRYPDPLNANGHSSAPELYAHNLSVGRGHVLLRVTYDPDPPYEPLQQDDPAYNGTPTGKSNPTPDPMSKHMRIELVGVLDIGATVLRKVTAYKPLPLLDYALWVTNRTNSGRGTVLGFDPWVDMTHDGTLWAGDSTERALPQLQSDFLQLIIRGGVCVNGTLNLDGENCDNVPDGTTKMTRNADQASTQILLRREPLPESTLPESTLPATDPLAWFATSWGGGYLADDKVVARDQIVETRTDKDAGDNTYQAQSTSIVKLYNDAGSVARMQTPTATDPPHFPAFTIWPSSSTTGTAQPFNTYADDFGAAVLDNGAGTDAAGISRSAGEITAPQLFQTDPQTNVQRYRQLTQYSGEVVFNPTAGQAHNTGQYGAGNGIYVDNSSDLQFVNADGTHDLDLLMEDWLQHIGPDHPRASETGWNATRVTYSPPGVIIELFPTEEATIDYRDTTTDVIDNHWTPPAANDLAADGLPKIWWPGHVPGQPGIRITRTDGNWRLGDPSSAGTIGDDSGRRTMCRDYPTTGNQVIYAEGNVRIKGVLPANMRASGNGLLTRDYNLTVVSGGTIYVDGQILTVQDAAGRKAGTDAAIDPAHLGAVLDEDTPKLALLAGDSVCVNPTQIMPQMTYGTVAAGADDPTNPANSGRHWDLTPDGSGYVYTHWMFGALPPHWVPGTARADRERLALQAYQTAQAPGPAGVSLTLLRYNQGPPVTLFTRSFDFDQSDSVPSPRLPDYGFIFVPPGAGLGGGIFAPRPWTSEMLSPLWEREDLYPDGRQGPQLPWWLESAAGPDSTYLADTATGELSPGQYYALQFRYSNPNLGVAATNYWLKKFKLAAYAPTDTFGTPMPPVPAINAKINAVMYAQDGCFFIIPGDYFDERWTGADALYNRRYHYSLEIRGAISENYHARPEAWREWQDKWAYPNSKWELPPRNTGEDLQISTAGGWNTIMYHFDETLLAPRDQARTLMVGNIRRADPATPYEAVAASYLSNLPKLPLLPVGRDLIYAE